MARPMAESFTPNDEIDEMGQLGVDAHVRHDRFGVPAGMQDPVHGLRGALRVAIGDDDPGPFARHDLGAGAADP